MAGSHVWSERHKKQNKVNKGIFFFKKKKERYYRFTVKKPKKKKKTKGRGSRVSSYPIVLL